jgi:VanZ family protein
VVRLKVNFNILPSVARSLIPALVWAAVILVLTSLPGVPSIGPRGSDKLAHFAIYFVLGVLCTPYITHAEDRRGLRVAGVLAVTIMFAALDEVHQLVIPGRDASMSDLVADCAGLIAGLACGLGFVSRRRAKK